MKESVSHQAPKVMYVNFRSIGTQYTNLHPYISSKKLQFSILNNQDTVKVSEFEVTHRDLYTAADRLPVKDGVLDRRLVSELLQFRLLISNFWMIRVLRRRVHSARRAGCRLWNVLDTMRTSSLLFPSST